MSDIPIEETDEEPEEEGSWLTTFADLATLLMTFFVLILSFAQMDVVKFRDALGSLQNAFGYAESTTGLTKNPTTGPIVVYEKIKPPESDPAIMPKQRDTITKDIVTLKENQNQEVLDRLKESIEANDMEDMVQAELTGQGVVVRVKGKLMFGAGSAGLKEESQPLLDEIINIIEESDYNVNIEGHTDNIPIRTPRYPSNWELSSTRAISALKYVLSSGKIDVKRLGAVGYADTRPIADNETAEGREMNRRVEFIFFADKDVDEMEFR